MPENPCDGCHLNSPEISQLKGASSSSVQKFNVFGGLKHQAFVKNRAIRRQLDTGKLVSHRSHFPVPCAWLRWATLTLTTSPRPPSTDRREMSMSIMPNLCRTKAPLLGHIRRLLRRHPIIHTVFGEDRFDGAVTFKFG